MTSVEQRRKLQELQRYRGKMSKEERYDFDMMVKRDRDDEQLDALTIKTLEDLHAKFVPKRSRDQLNDAWGKLTGGKE